MIWIAVSILLLAFVIFGKKQRIKVVEKEVVKEVIKEVKVPIEVIKEVEKIVEVEVEAIKEVEVIKEIINTEKVNLEYQSGDLSIDGDLVVDGYLDVSGEITCYKIKEDK